MTTIDKPKVPKIPEPPLGVSREILGDPSGGDGGGGEESMLGARTEERRGETRRKTARRMRDERRTGHARHAAEEPEEWRRNTRDRTWRRSSGEPQPGPVSLAQAGLWRPWVAQDGTEEPRQTIVSIFDPSTKDNPEYFTTTIIRSKEGDPLLIFKSFILRLCFKISLRRREWNRVRNSLHVSISCPRRNLEVKSSIT